jgi:outer membrane protein assembly factor BamA
VPALCCIIWTCGTIKGNDSIPAGNNKNKKMRTLIFPVIGRTPETSWLFGTAAILVFKTRPSDTLLRTSTIPLGIIYTIKKQIIISNGVNIYFPREKYIFRLENSYTEFPDKFWGLGFDTPYSNLENYSYEQLFINPQFLKKIHKNYFAGLCLEYQHNFDINYLQGGLFDKENIAGRHRSKILGIGVEFTVDNRNSTFSPSKGYMIKFQHLVFSKYFSSDFNFHATEVDIRRFKQLNKDHVLTFQLVSMFTSGEVPFRNLAMLGGANIMRGYYAGRYRDKNMIAFQIEHRAHLWWRLGAVGFAGLGQVSADGLHWHLNKTKYSLGAGIRFAVLPREKLNLRLDYGFGFHSSNFYLTVTEAF